MRSSPIKILVSAFAATVVCGVLMVTGAGAAPSARTSHDRLADGATVFGRQIALHIDDPAAVGWATISSGSPTDEVWLERSLHHGTDPRSARRLGDITIATGQSSATTPRISLRDPATYRVGALRACGKAGNRDDVACTGWQSVQRPPRLTTPARGAADALMKLYDPATGLWKTTGWWNSANDLTALIDYATNTGDHRYDWAIANTYDKNLAAQGGQFTNDYIDDTGWWALAWTRAYEYTHDGRYLATARHDADYMWSYRDDHCGGGLYWNVGKNYKNAVTNELFIKVAAGLRNNIPGDRTYLARAQAVWEWFRSSGMINSQHLINDGLDNATCTNNHQQTWTYNQGVVLGGLSELYRATHDRGYLRTARTLADASTRSRFLNPHGVLTEPCEATGCGADGPTFKGAYVRNLGELNALTPRRPYQRYLRHQATTSFTHDRNAYNQYGVHWAGPVAELSAATQGSGLDAQNAPAEGHRHGKGETAT